MSDTAALAALPPLREVIAEHGLAARRSLGQHFLFDLNLTRRIARAAGPLEGRTVVEIGPGPGGLTRALLMEGASAVLAVERDRRCLPALNDIAAAAGGRLHVAEADALALDEPAALRQAGLPTPALVAANLPYNVGSALLVKWLTADPWPPWYDALTLMFQREVAERITARPHSKAYGRLSVLSQWRMTAAILFDINPSAFTPPPQVVSTVVRLTPKARPEPDIPHTLLASVTAAAFAQRRKMLRASLRSLTDRVADLLAAAELDPQLRADQVDVEGYGRLAAAYGHLNA